MVAEDSLDLEEARRRLQESYRLISEGGSQELIDHEAEMALHQRIAIVEGLTDPTTGLMMGNTAERVAQRFDIDRAAMDAYALQSHQRAAGALERDRFAREVAPMVAPPSFRSAVSSDDGVRTEQTIEALQKLRPVFDRRGKLVGVVTGLRTRTWKGPGALVETEHCLVVPVGTLRDRLEEWKVSYDLERTGPE